MSMDINSHLPTPIHPHSPTQAKAIITGAATVTGAVVVITVVGETIVAGIIAVMSNGTTEGDQIISRLNQPTQ
jgi:hypothetical protein